MLHHAHNCISLTLHLQCGTHLDADLERYTEVLISGLRDLPSSLENANDVASEAEEQILRTDKSIKMTSNMFGLKAKYQSLLKELKANPKAVVKRMEDLRDYSQS